MLANSLRYCTHAQAVLALCSKLASSSPRDERPDVSGLSSRGGDDGIRTHDPLLAGQVLSQLSYTPIKGFAFSTFFRSGERISPFS